MATAVYFGSAKQSRLTAEETLPAKLDIIIDKLNLRERVKDKSVAIKMHLGGNIGYSTIHPVFVRKVVQAVKDGGGNPFITDTPWACFSAHERGYAQETVGCPIIPCAGPTEKYYKVFNHPFKQIKEWQVGGTLLDADFLVNFAHVKGHPTCGMGGLFKNLALGAMTGQTRGAIHDTFHFDPYWFPDKCPDAATRQKILESCPMDAIVLDKNDEQVLHLHMDNCNQCGECQKVAPDGALKISQTNAYAFQEACAIGVSHVLSTFQPDRAVFINVATHLTPVCDCFGFTGLPMLPDVGIFGGDDICAVEQATLDAIGKLDVIEDNLPLQMMVQRGDGLHPFQVVHGRYKDPYKVIEYGAALGLGSREYDLADVLPLEGFRPKASDMAVSSTGR